MALTADRITDLSNLTLKNLGKFKMVELAADLPEYIAASNLLNKNRIKFDSGTAIQWNVLLNGDDNARNIGLYARDMVNVKDGTLQLSIPWRHTTSSAGYDVKEVMMNSDPSKIVDIVKTRRYQRAISWVEIMESNFWQGVASSTDDETPWGLFGYWLNYNASTGFNGSNGNYGSIGGKDADTYTKLKHYTFQYTTVSDSDLVAKIRECLVKTAFKPMVKNAPVPGYANGQRRVMYAGYDVCSGLETLVRANNDNLGNDLDKYKGQVYISGVPVQYAPYIEENKSTSKPIVGIDWAQFQAVFLKDRWMQETPFEKDASSHDMRRGFLDSTYNFRCFDRRKGLWLGALSDPLTA